MELKDFTKVFDGLSNELSEERQAQIETAFMEDGDFAWNVSFRNTGAFNRFVDDVVTMDLGLSEGEVRKFTSSLGCQMIFIGTFAGNMVIHQRRPFHRTEPIPQSSGRVTVVCYAPKELQDIVGSKAIDISDLYRYTGFFNPASNIGNSLKKLRKSLAA